MKNNFKRTRGEENPGATITEELVRDIRFRYKAGEKPKSIAEDTGLRHQHVMGIVKKRLWAHVH